MKNERTYEVSVKEFNDEKLVDIFKTLVNEIKKNSLMFVRGELVKKNDWSITFRTDKRREALDMLCFMDKVFKENEIIVDIDG